MREKDVVVRPRKKGRGGWGTHLIGLAGLACIVVAAVGLVQSTGHQERKGREGSADRRREEGTRKASYYPLEVGRYWVYVRQDPGTGAVTEVERRIVRRERRPEREVFFFSDGTIAYQQDGKVFEVPPGGGLDVIPIDLALQGAPYVYRSQGLHIEKHIGVRDTALVLDERRYESCLQVITHFRPTEQKGEATMSYASYYARGVGLVRWEPWPRQANEAPTIVLRDYGPQPM